MATESVTNIQPGQVARPTRISIPGTFYTRPKASKRNTARAFVDRMRIKGDSRAEFYAQILKADPDAVLMREHQRGVSFRGERFETRRLVLVRSDVRLRIVQARPGYRETYSVSVGGA